ncbi:g10734 [Coccomyxa elongata]
MSYNDTNSTYIPKKVVANCKSEAQLESFMKIAFDMPAGRPVKLAFKPTGEQQKQRFLKEYVAEQLSIAVAVHIDDA